MKIFHTADLHLGSKMLVFSEAEAKERREELLLTFSAIISRALSEKAEAVIIAGDLFDGAYPSITLREEVRSLFLSAAELKFILISGNHDEGIPHSFINSLPDNVKVFGRWPDKTELSEGVTVYGAENMEEIQYELGAFEKSRINIVTAHGVPVSGGRRGGIDLDRFAALNVDYLALGHYHSYSSGKLGRGVWCMSGTPEGRGFDETGEKGYVEIEVEGGVLTHRFVPFCKRRLYDLEVDVSGAERGDVYLKIKTLLCESKTSRDIVRITLRGVTGETDTDYSFFEKRGEQEGLAHRLIIRNAALFRSEASEISLLAEFRKQVAALSLTEEERSEILRMGVRALKGEKD